MKSPIIDFVRDCVDSYSNSNIKLVSFFTNTEVFKTLDTGGLNYDFEPITIVNPNFTNLKCFLFGVAWFTSDDVPKDEVRFVTDTGKMSTLQFVCDIETM